MKSSARVCSVAGIQHSRARRSRRCVRGLAFAAWPLFAVGALTCGTAWAQSGEGLTDRLPVSFRYEPPKASEAAVSEERLKGSSSEAARGSDEIGSKVAEFAPPKKFGAAGSRWWTIGTGIADNLNDAVDSNVHFAYTYFLAPNIEFTAEFAGWYFNQPGDNPVGASAVMVFRWHFINTGAWTVYADTGVGFLAATDNVPEAGTSFDLMPRFGVGFTRQLTESGTRLQMGVRWHHASNARIFGDASNPARDSAMVYAGIMFPF